MKDSICGTDGAAAMASLREKAYRDHVPLSVSLALTAQCNLHCNICYIPAPARFQAPRDFVFWDRVIRESAELGALHALLTGGECLLHPDFCAIYRLIRSQGMLATVFTNGTVLKEEHLDVLAEMPPTAVEISLYGSSDEAWQSVTGRSGGWTACRKGVERLLARDIKIRLKMLLIRESQKDLDALREWARTLGVSFRFDPCLFPRMDGDPEPIHHRLEVEEAADIEFADPALREEWIRFHQHFSSVPEEAGLYDCGAGRTSFHIEPDGTLYPCLMVKTPSVRLDGVSVAEAWKRLWQAVSLEKLPVDSPCRACEAKVLCGYCPGFFELETGSRFQKSEYLCAMGMARLKRVKAPLPAGVEKS